MTLRTHESTHPSFSTLVEALSYWSKTAPERPALAFLADGESESARLTYAELDREVRRVSAGLQQLMAPGDRALLCFSPGLDFVIGYFACLYAGIIAVPVPAPTRARQLERVAAIAENAGATIALTSAETLRNTRGLPDAAAAGLRLIAIDTLGSDSADRWSPPPIAPGDVAFLQYTSGSTATPKGVVVAHENLAANIEMIRAACMGDAAVVTVSWLPVHHDMGLIGSILTTLWHGSFVALMPPLAFLQKPVRWLRAISKYRATNTAAPNFAYDLCCRRLSADDIAQLDLSSLNILCNGAEPIRTETLEAFCRTFEPAGLRRSAVFPCYGLAEATLYSSGRHFGLDSGILLDKKSLQGGQVVTTSSETDATRVVSCGSSPAGQCIAIVSPETLCECGADEVGEIWLSGSNIANGYWNDVASTQAVFRATLPTRSGMTFLRTGDLGFVRGGELFVAGRLKDLVIIAGKNHYPQDIELTVERASSAIGAAAAFSLPDGEAEGLAIVAEVARNLALADYQAIGEGISNAVWNEHELGVSRIVL